MRRRFQMAKVRFESDSTHLELSGSETFVWRQLQLLARFLGDVDRDVLLEQTTQAIQDPTPPPGAGIEAAAPQAADVERGARLLWAETATVPGPPARPGAAEEADEAPEPPAEVSAEALGRFFDTVASDGGADQADAALLFSYFLQEDQGRRTVTLSDLLRCCIRVGVDSRNFHEVLDVLRERGHLEPARAGGAWRLSPSGVAAVEERLA
ncbi:MAG: hypothetical protein ACE5JG_10605 [Planctomycetota bacterium]